MRKIETNGYSLEIGSLDSSSLRTLLKEKYANSTKMIIVDDNTHEFCLNYLITNFEELADAEIMVLPMGEENKQIEVATSIWGALTEYNITRYDVLINLGGGVITDMGGFVASVYKRGCDFINIPTSLLAMIDASIGGKTGLNLEKYKNQIGLFSNPVALYIDPSFLETLPVEEVKSGFAEMLKHGLICDADLFKDVCDQMQDPENIPEELLVRCIEVKNEIVMQDPHEAGVRKILNFGHTIGHAIEGHFMETKPLTHGHAVAIGMVMEAYLSVKISGLSQESYDEIEDYLLAGYGLPKFSDEDINAMIVMLSNDKKNKGNKIQCCLLESIGKCLYDVEISQELFLETFLHFKNKQLNLN
ncbi:MAG: 3-dehydroquinate synthase [Crocinitomicaceae bacterium]|nr:3-dehydroquinate synthase [Crocinitomicaceae bacterium]